MKQVSFSRYTVRFSDCDPLGHLNNARYIDYFLNAREDHLRADYQLDLPTWYKKGLGWVVQKHEISYLRPARFNETVCIRSLLLVATDDQLLVEMLMLDEKCLQLKSLVHTTFIPVSIETGRKASHHPAFMESIREMIFPGIDPGTLSVKERIGSWQDEIKGTAGTQVINS